MRIELKDLEKGNKVWCGGDSGFCYSDIVEVQDITYKFDENTGEKYKVIHASSQRFDSRNGAPLEPPTAYYIKSCEQQHEGYIENPSAPIASTRTFEDECKIYVDKEADEWVFKYQGEIKKRSKSKFDCLIAKKKIQKELGV